MRLALVAEVYPPLRSSGAVQLRDLSLELVRQGHEVTVMVASPDLSQPWLIEDWNGVRVLRLRTPRNRDIGYARRTAAEFLMPFMMLRHLRMSPLSNEMWDGVMWYSPSIFLGPLIQHIKSRSNCKSYLILRDIFPDWAVDIGLMRRGLPYMVFKQVAKYQYSVADVIGVQSPGNLVYFGKWRRQTGKRLEVLQNWLQASEKLGCSISLDSTSLAGRRIFVYAGNMGVAQGMGIFLELAYLLRDRLDIGFVFVGRGSDVPLLREQAKRRGLSNVLFFDEIEPDEIQGLYAQCHIGLVALDPRHKSHNIPGKFLSYMQSGLPVLARVNTGNDLVELIVSSQVGKVCVENSAQELGDKAKDLLGELDCDNDYALRCKELAARLFSPRAAADQIVKAIQS